MYIKIALLLFSTLVISNCNSSKKSSESKQERLNPVVDTMSPGTALVEFEIINISSTNNTENSIYEVKILKVLKYGSSTPIIDRGSVHSLSINKDKYQDTLNKGAKVAAVLAYEQQIAQYANESNWKLLSIKN